MTTESHMVDEAIQQGATLGEPEWAQTVEEAVQEATGRPLLGAMRWAYPSDLPYSYAEFPADVDLKWAMQKFANQVAAYRKVMAHVATPPQQNAPQRPNAGAQQPQRAQGAPQGGDARLSRSWGLCPDCGTEAKPSILKYQQWEEDEEGNEVPAKHFCPNDNCQTKSLWRRQLTAEAIPF